MSCSARHGFIRRASIAAVASALTLVAAGRGESGANNPAARIPERVLEQVSSGVGLVQPLDCRGRPFRFGGETVSGTGFLVGSRVLMTAEHVVWGPSRRGCGLRVRVSGPWYEAVDVYVWRERGEDDRRGVDLATVELARAAPGHVFSFARRSPAVGSPLATIGHPLGGPLSVSEGTLSKRVVDYGKPQLAAKIQTEVGSSGGPIVNGRGEVIGILSRIVIWANRTRDGSHRHSGVDIVRWWPSVRPDLCRTHPSGAIPGCTRAAARGATVKVPIRIH